MDDKFEGSGKFREWMTSSREAASFGDGRQVLGKRQVREQKPYVLACPTYPRTNWEYLPKHGHSISFKVTWLIGKVKAQCQKTDVFKGWDWQGFTKVFICFYKYVNRIPTDFHRPPLYIGQQAILITKGNPIRTNVLPIQAHVAKLAPFRIASASVLRNVRIALVFQSK